MITPKEFRLDDFMEKEPTVGTEGEKHLAAQAYRALAFEDLKNSDLIDNLFLLRFLPIQDLQEVLRDKYNIAFTWLQVDPTPEELRPISEQYHVFFQREQTRMIVYVPLGVTLDDSMLQVEIPNYVFQYVFIADCNYRTIKTGIPVNIITNKICNFRPLLVARQLILSSIRHGSTDLHFASIFVDKVARHFVQYRINRDIVASDVYRLDYDMIQRVITAIVGKLSTASASDITSLQGLTTSVSNVFGDGTTDLRIVSIPCIAGLDVTIAIQTTTTTTLTVEQLGFPKADVLLIREIARRRTGLTLVTGQMRSGKNTTIYAMLNEIKDDPIRLVEYSNPVEVRMPWVQFDYRGDIEILKSYLKLAKKSDIDTAILNEIPNDEVAFAVRDLVNSAIGVITTTHVNRAWHVPLKLHEFFGKDYKTIISQLNAIINQKMFRRVHAPGMQKRILQQGPGEFEKFAYRMGVRQYFVPTSMAQATFSLQPLTEIIVLTDEEKTALLNYTEISKAEQMIEMHIDRDHGRIEHKLAQYINEGICLLDEMKRIH